LEIMMAQWTEQGEKLVSDVACRYGASHEAVSLMLESILRGNGTMAQFNINELGGCGQWMRGGMTMVGDMFNYQLKSRVDGICGELSSAVVDQNLQVVPPPPPLKSGVGPSGHVSSGQAASQWNQWWPAELGAPNTSGSQNQYRYAYFAGPRRLAISDGQAVTVYDTLDHNIGGVSQQQGSVAGVGFTSQYGNVDLRTLPLVSGIAVGTFHSPSIPIQEQIHVSVPQSSAAREDLVQPFPIASVNQKVLSNEDVFSTIERLAKLRDAGALTEDEFVSKKTELLARI
jgi:hypothetical protein